MKAISIAAGFAMAAMMTATAGAQDKAIIVLDGSGSMWGQIDGKAKISIARVVLSDVLSKTTTDLSLGLMSYGHRRKGDCGDIELIVEPGTGGAAAIAAAADRISPVGKTPLTDAVRRAAETLKYGEDKATVILITDGIETCRADPCALAAELEKTGIDFTAHVVGFGLSAAEGQQVACIAEETGGLYIPAENAGALGKALSDTVQEAAATPEPVPEPVEDEKVELPAASLNAPDSVEIGRRFDVIWDGPGDRFDDVVLFDPQGNNGEGKALRSRRLSNADYDNRSVTLIAPARPNTYEIHYYFGRGQTVIARRPIDVVDAEVSLDAPATVEIGRRFKVGWVGPGGRRDSVEIVDPTGNQGEGKALRGRRLVNDDFDNRLVTLVAPADPGFYRLRYWNGDNRTVLATREIEVLDAEVILAAPDNVPIGRSFTVDWIGPGGRRDAVEIFDEAANQGRGKAVVSKRLVNDDFDNNKVSLLAPARPGDYLLRYYNGENRKVLATRPIAVEETDVSVTSQASVPIAHLLEVAWVGPGATRDAIELFDPNAQAGRGKVMKSVRLVNGDYDGQTVKLGMVAKPGTYQLRYWSGASRIVLATAPIEVLDMAVSLDGPESIGVEEMVAVAWEGPGAFRDAIEIFDPAANGGKGRTLVSKRLVNDDYDNKKLQIKAPKTPGSFRLRYYNADNRAVLAETDLVVR